MVYIELLQRAIDYSSEVDPNRSLWYTTIHSQENRLMVLKLTPTGHYGIVHAAGKYIEPCSEVDPNRSLWYILGRV